MSKNKDITQSADSENIATVGEQLRLGREQAKLSIDDVAKKLCLSISIVNDIESDNISASTSTVFSKGYVKSYAVLLNLPKDELLECFDNQYQLNNDVKQMQTFSNRTQNMTHNSYLNLITAAVILIMIIGVSVWWWQQVEEPVVIVPANPTAIVNNEPSPRLPLVPSIDSSARTQTTIIESTFTFSSDCWVKVVDSTNAVIAVGIKKAGTSIDISGVAPLEVILGAPNAVKITYQQELLDISSYIVKDTATFTLPLGK